MNKFFYLLLATAVLSFVSCDNDKPASGTTDTTTEENGAMNSSLSTAVSQGNGSMGTPVVPALDVTYVDLLLTDYWVAERWVDHKNRGNGEPDKGHWWKFNPDGTMQLGHWEDAITEGVWTAVASTKVPTNTILHIDAADDKYDMEFEIQGKSTGGDYMSWAGTKRYKMNNIAVKAIALLSIPTKKQFGVE